MHSQIRLRVAPRAPLTLAQRVAIYATLATCRTPAVRAAVEAYLLEVEIPAGDRELILLAAEEV